MFKLQTRVYKGDKYIFRVISSIDHVKHLFKMNFVNGIFIIILEILVVASCVKINKLQVPQVIQHGRAVVLDCDFTLDETEQDLVVKWFFNKNNQTLVYQWIPAASNNKPKALGVLKNRLNLGYKAGDDANSIHRALHILQAAPDLSGDYTCSVSTVQSEDIQTKRMLVFVPEKNLMIHRLGSEKQGLIRLECSAEGVFPKPEISINSHKRGTIKTEMSSKLRGSLYDVSARTITLNTLEDPEEFSCELKIPQANYTVQQKTVVSSGYLGNKGLRVGGNIWIISTSVFLLSQVLTGTSFKRRSMIMEFIP
ncbi:hypothetical protein WA026_005234 [Henosepilachna vigintioctopunctata]|uniref:Ig-like domain-containing protein n=1 Tax=Henosepilachna vigintioctopunctata TaxID=420089 RepID=A0AAW1UWF0_9CUCU